MFSVDEKKRTVFATQYLGLFDTVHVNKEENHSCVHAGFNDGCCLDCTTKANTPEFTEFKNERLQLFEDLSEVDLFKCRFCNGPFEDLPNLLAHMYQRHLNEKFNFDVFQYVERG